MSYVGVFDTILPGDSVEFAPHPDALDILVCGTYKLDEPSPTSLSSDSEDDSTVTPSQQSRRGKCLVFQVDASLPTRAQGLTPIQTIDLPAITDMKWCHSRTPTLGIADSEGNITLHQWQEPTRRLEPIDAIRCASSEILCLSLDWSNRRDSGNGLGSLIVSLSNGSLCLLRPRDAYGLLPSNSWHAHDNEPWVAAWNYWNTNVVYSGGDDLKMKAWDIRLDCSQPLLVNKRFDAGVTSIQCNPHIEHLVAVGSYDNKVKLFDTRSFFMPLAEVDVGGGAWRVKWHPCLGRRNDLLVACMHDGFKVISFEDNGNAHGEVVKRFDAHESLAYGADWSFSPGEDGRTMIATCSFYDHKLHLWHG